MSLSSCDVERLDLPKISLFSQSSAKTPSQFGTAFDFAYAYGLENLYELYDFARFFRVRSNKRDTDR